MLNIKLYLQDILFLSGLPKKYERILSELIKHSTYAGEKYGMEIVLNSTIKKRIAEILEFDNVRSIDNALTTLVNAEILVRQDRGIYALNPLFFGKGNWQNISNLSLEIKYNSDGTKEISVTKKYLD